MTTLRLILSLLTSTHSLTGACLILAGQKP